MSEFQHLDLTESYILGWSLEPDLVFDVEFFVLPGHPRYRLPKAGELGCYVRGQLRFPATTRALGLRSIEDVRGSVDADGARDYGNFDDLAAGPDGFVLEGEFGTVTVTSDAPRVDLGSAG